MNAETATTLNPLSPALLADLLGDARAELAQAKEKVKELEEALKSLDITEAEGSRYRATVAHVERAQVDWKAVAAKLKPSRQLVTAHTRHLSYDQVRVTALKK